MIKTPSTLVTKEREPQFQLMKWIAFVSMFVDHAQKAGLWTSTPLSSAFGRLAFPLFVIAFSAGTIARWRLGREIHWLRITGFGFVAQLVFPFVFGLHWWSLNILFVFVVGGAVWKLASMGRTYHWLGALILLMVSWRLFAQFSYGVIGPVCVASGLFAFASNGVKRWMIAGIGMTIWSLSIPEQRFMGIVSVAIVAAITLRWGRVAPVIQVSFGGLYVIHIYLIAALKSGYFYSQH